MASVTNAAGEEDPRPIIALAKFAEAARRDPAFALAANNLGFTYYRLERHAESREWFERTVAIDPKRAVAYLNLGDAYLKLGHACDIRRSRSRASTPGAARRSRPSARQGRSARPDCASLLPGPVPDRIQFESSSRQRSVSEEAMFVFVNFTRFKEGP